MLPTGTTTPTRSREMDDRVRRLRETQRLYPAGSVSWNNLQAQIDALEPRER
jgi:hypothetical protein